MKRSIPDEHGSEINITPMLDVVFILLIFFIVTTSFERERGLDISRPSAGATNPERQDIVLVLLGGNGEIRINDRPVDIESVRANIEQALALNPDATVVISADRRARTGTLVGVVDQAKLAGVAAVSVAAVR